MSFVSVSFAGLLALVLLLRFSVGRSGRGPGFLGSLYVLSLVFYAWHVPAYLAILLLSTATDWLAALAIERAAGRTSVRRAWLGASLAVNLGLLGFFKYSGLLGETAAALARAVGFSAETPVAVVVLPRSP